MQPAKATKAALVMHISTAHAVGIPSAPGAGGSTRRAALQANIIGTGVFSGMNMSPIGLSLPSQYVLEFDCWQNFNGQHLLAATDRLTSPK